MNALKLFFYIVFLLGISPSYCQQESETKDFNQKLLSEVTLLSGADNHAQLVESLIQEPIVLSKVSFESDCHLTEEEFYYLTNLREGMQLNRALLQKAIINL